MHARELQALSSVTCLVALGSQTQVSVKVPALCRVFCHGLCGCTAHCSKPGSPAALDTAAAQLPDAHLGPGAGGMDVGHEAFTDDRVPWDGDTRLGVSVLISACACCSSAQVSASSSLRWCTSAGIWDDPINLMWPYGRTGPQQMPRPMLRWRQPRRQSVQRTCLPLTGPAPATRPMLHQPEHLLCDTKRPPPARQPQSAAHQQAAVVAHHPVQPVEQRLDHSHAATPRRQLQRPPSTRCCRMRQLSRPAQQRC